MVSAGYSGHTIGSVAEVLDQATGFPRAWIAQDERVGPGIQCNPKKRKFSMITNKEDDRKNQELGLDVDTFAMQVNQEIDSLFVPAGLGDGEEESASDIQMVDDVEIQVVGDHSSEGTADPLVGEASVGTASKGMDMDAFEERIDVEIDNLFVPTDLDDMSMDQPTIGVAGKEHAAFGAPQVQAPVMQFADEQADPVRVDLQVEVPAQEPAMLTSQDAPPTSEAEAPPLAQSPVAPVVMEQGSELPNLVEDLNIAYLSLDWEFSSENLSKLWLALEGLQDHCGKSRETLFLFKLMRSLLHRLTKEPDSVQPEIIEMMRDGHEALKDLLLSSNGPDAEEKQKLKDLASRYRVLRDGSAEKVDGSVVETPQAEKPSPFLVFSGDHVVDWHSMTRDAFPEWMQGHVLKATELEKVLVKELADIVSCGDGRDKKPAVGELSSKLNQLRSIVEEYAAISRSREQEWKNGVEWLFRFGGNGDAAQVIPEETAGPESVMEDPAARTHHSAPSTPRSPGERREEQVFLFSVGGRKLGILAKHVVKIDGVNNRKVDKIVARGHATLADFKPFYRSLKAGLLGAWSGLPSEILKTYRFVPISLENQGEDRPTFALGGAVLVSSGRNHGVIFVDSGAVDLHDAALTDIERGKRSMVLGLAQVESDPPVEVLNMDALLGRQRDAGGPEISQ